MNRLTLQWIIVSGLAFALAGGVAVWRAMTSGPLPAGTLKSVTEFRDDKPLPAFALAGPKGSFTNAQLLGHWSFLFFGYTQCPDICPTALGLMKTLKGQLAAVSPAPTFQAVFVSVDPARDTHALLGQYMAAFDPEFTGVTGDEAALKPLVKDLGVFYQRNDATDKKNYTVDHSATIYLIDPKGRLAATFSPPQVADAMVSDYRRITAR